MSAVNRRRFLSTATASLGLASLGVPLGADQGPAVLAEPPARAPIDPQLPDDRPDYTGPNVILVRFGGGVRRRETILEPHRTYCPFIYHTLGEEHGVIYPDMEIESRPGIATSHGEGTLYLLTGQYRHYEDVSGKFLGNRFEAPSPTLFEYFRKAYNVPAHQALLVNGEDRIDEEFFTASGHHLYGVRYKATVLSLYRFKLYALRRDLEDPNLPDRERREKEETLRRLEELDYRTVNRNSESVRGADLDAFWDQWSRHYGRTGFVNPRGDRLLTTLSIWALKKLRPRLMMINYQDPDYVHWGNPSFYTRAISIIDEGVREIYNTVQNDPEVRDEYAGRTVFVVVPDCGRDDNRCMAVPYQHHFNTRSAHEIFGVVAGPTEYVPRGLEDRKVQQISVAATVGRIMGFPTPEVEAGSLFDRNG